MFRDLMPVQRRRHHRYPCRLIPSIAIVSSAILLLFVFLYFLAPSPRENYYVHQAWINDEYGDENAIPASRIPNSEGGNQRDLWSTENARFYYGCCNASNNFSRAADITMPNRYLAISTSGGLNQQRTGITDAVVAARILNATLVVPKLDQKSFWKDTSNFSEIFDVDWFISYLENDVKIIKELPQRRGQTWVPRRTRVPRKCNEQCYINRLLPVLLKKQAIQLTKFDYRLSNRLSSDLQKLRCKVNYHALTFTKPILEMAAKLVKRMRVRSKHYIALHLRFEPDMLAFSGCYYGGGDKENKDLAKIRRRWKTLHNRNPDRERRQGRCPLTPEEVGLLLRALGYDRQTHIYVASGEVYGGEASLAPLKALFPNFYSKDTLTRREELAPFSEFSSRMAALDFIVCDESDVFVTNNNGNMAKILAGRRRYFGHKPTIRPNAKKLYKLFPRRSNMTWEEFTSSVNQFQQGFMGVPKEVRPGRGGFHENPTACICEDAEAKAKAKAKMKSVPKETVKESSLKRYLDVPVGNQNTNDDLDWSDPEDEDDPTLLLENSDYDSVSYEDHEMDELVSD